MNERLSFAIRNGKVSRHGNVLASSSLSPTQSKTTTSFSTPLTPLPHRPVVVLPNMNALEPPTILRKSPEECPNTPRIEPLRRWSKQKIFRSSDYSPFRRVPQRTRSEHSSDNDSSATVSPLNSVTSTPSRTEYINEPFGEASPPEKKSIVARRNRTITSICITPPRKRSLFNVEELSPKIVCTPIRRITRSQTRAWRRLDCGYASPVKLSFGSGRSHKTEDIDDISPIRFHKRYSRSPDHFVKVRHKRAKLYAKNDVQSLIGRPIGNKVKPQFTFDLGYYGKYPHMRSIPKLETNSFRILRGCVQRKQKPKPRTKSLKRPLVAEIDSMAEKENVQSQPLAENRTNIFADPQPVRIKAQKGTVLYHIQKVAENLGIPDEIIDLSAKIFFSLKRHRDNPTLPLNDMKLMAACCLYFSCQRRGESRELLVIAKSCSVDITQLDQCCAKVGKLLNIYYRAEVPPPPPRARNYSPKYTPTAVQSPFQPRLLVFTPKRKSPRRAAVLSLHQIACFPPPPPPPPPPSR